ncbi:MAG: ATP-binding cassette domain-containing protein [Spirochaetales bacterium]
MIHLESLTFGYGKTVLFDKLDLKLPAGSIGGLLGLNGAGKTSLLKLIAGALLPQAGSMQVFGRNPARREAEHLAAVAFVPEDPWVPAQKPEAWLATQLPFRPAFDRALFDQLRRDFALTEDKPLSKLSYGQRKKFCLAFALASGANTLLLDEPTNGLDIPAKVTFRKMLAAAAREDRVILVSTHQVRDLENLIDPVLIMDQGKIPFVLPVTDLATELQAQGLGDLEALFNTALTEPGRLAALVGAIQGVAHA